MSKKKTTYIAIKTYVDKLSETGHPADVLNATVGAYESVKKEIQELKTVVNAKLEEKKAAHAAMEAAYKSARTIAKQTAAAARKEKKAASSSKK
ncbi:MAG: hypothetical protein WCT14_11325 [Treponemataceae bacterium]